MRRILTTLTLALALSAAALPLPGPGGRSLALAAGEADLELARRYFKLGEELYYQGSYREALAAFRKSHKLSGKGALYFNMARCQQSMGELEEAVALYEKFLATDPPQKDEVQTIVQNLKKLVAEKQRQAAEERAKKEKDVKLARPKPAVERGGPARATRQPPRAAGRPLRTAGWVLVGTGAAGMVAGVVLGALAGNKASSLEEDYAGFNRTYPEFQSAQSAGEALELGQIVGLAAGGAVAAAGAVLLIVDWRSHARERHVSVMPVVGPGQAGVAAGVQF